MAVRYRRAARWIKSTEEKKADILLFGASNFGHPLLRILSHEKVRCDELEVLPADGFCLGRRHSRLFVTLSNDDRVSVPGMGLIPLEARWDSA